MFMKEMGTDGFGKAVTCSKDTRRQGSVMGLDSIARVRLCGHMEQSSNRYMDPLTALIMRTVDTTEDGG